MVVQAFNHATAHAFGDGLAEQGRLRKRFCIDKRNWQRLQSSGMEYDEFDTPAAWYFVYRDKMGLVRGCNRLIPTSTDYMIEHLWPDMVTKAPIPKSPRIWEQSRFCIDDELPMEEKGRAVSELLVALEEFAQAMDIDEFWWLALPENVRFLGKNAEALGPLVDVDGDECFVGRSIIGDGAADKAVLKRFGIPEKGVLQWLPVTERAA